MIDGAFLRKKFHATFKRDIVANDVEQIVKCILNSIKKENKSFRAYFYDCNPCTVKTSYPISNKKYWFEETEQYKKGLELLKSISELDFFAVRLGELQFSGWSLKKNCYENRETYTDECFTPNLSQKGVDIKIGLDIAWISYQKTAKNIVLITGDSDFVPAIKVARRNGVFVWLYTLNHNVKPELIKNADVAKKDDLQRIIYGVEDEYPW